MVAMGYLLAFLFAAMPLLGFGKYEVEPFGLSCTLDWIGKDTGKLILKLGYRITQQNVFI